jgi:hypothetical protein
MARQCTADHELHRRAPVTCPQWDAAKRASSLPDAHKLECFRVLYIPKGYEKWVQPYFRRCREIRSLWEKHGSIGVGTGMPKAATWRASRPKITNNASAPSFVCEDAGRPSRTNIDWHEDIHSVCGLASVMADARRAAGGDGLGLGNSG